MSAEVLSGKLCRLPRSRTHNRARSRAHNRARSRARSRAHSLPRSLPLSPPRRLPRRLPRSRPRQFLVGILGVCKSDRSELLLRNKEGSPPGCELLISQKATVRQINLLRQEFMVFQIDLLLQEVMVFQIGLLLQEVMVCQFHKLKQCCEPPSELLQMGRDTPHSFEDLQHHQDEVLLRTFQWIR